MAFSKAMYDELRERASLAQWVDEFLEVRTRLANGNPYSCVCPICGSGEGKNRTAALYLNPNDPLHWHCFSCDSRGDIYDLVGAVSKVDALKDRAALVAEWANVDIEELRAPNLKGRMQMANDRTRRAIAREREAAEQAKVWERNRKVEAERLAQLLQTPLAPEAKAYLAGRGIDEATAKAWHLGYNPTSRRVVIPYPCSTYYHADRDITNTQDVKYLKPNSGLVGHEPMWNPDALNAKAIVLVEGQLDALAVQSVGYEAVACGGIGISPTLEEIKSRGGYDGVALLMHDNDEAGRTARTRTAKALKAAGVRTVLFNGWPEDFKDPFDWWQRSPEGLKNAIASALEGVA